MMASYDLSPPPLSPISRRRWLAAGTLAVLGLTACASNAPPPQWLALPAPELPAPRAAVAPKQHVQLGRLDLPEYWLTSAVRFREGSGVIGTWPHIRWAERVEVSLTQHLSVALAQRLPPAWQLCLPPCTSATQNVSRVQVALTVLDYHRDTGTLKAWARWSVAAGPGQPVQTHEQAFVLPGSPASPGDQAASLARLMQVLGEAITASLIV